MKWVLGIFKKIFDKIYLPSYIKLAIEDIGYIVYLILMAENKFLTPGSGLEKSAFVLENFLKEINTRWDNDTKDILQRVIDAVVAYLNKVVWVK